MSNPRRILVLGSPGSGKTTLARKLSALYEVPITHLDTIYHTTKWPTEEAEKKDLWLRKLLPVLKTQNWIMDSSNKRVIDSQLEYATEVIFLDCPRAVTFYRLLKRRVKFHRERRPEMPNDWEERIDLQFWGFVWRFSKDEKPVILSKLEHPRKDQTITILLASQVKGYFKNLKM